MTAAGSRCPSEGLGWVGMGLDGAVLDPCSLGLFGEIFVGELDGDGAFPDGRGDALDGPVARVTGGEYARQAGLQEQRRPR